MSKVFLLERLNRANPGWTEWDELISLVDSLEFEFISNQYLGNHYASGTRLAFCEDANRDWANWLPPYVRAIHGMKADYWEMAGGFADLFSGRPAKRGAWFSPAGNDAELGFPPIDVPDNIYPFQSNSSGASFFIDKELNIVYPNSINRRFEILDPLEVFTKVNIRQIVDGARWFDAYCDKIKGDILD